MCFMFGAGKEHVHRVLGLITEVRPEQEVTDVEGVSVTSVREDRSRDRCRTAPQA